MIRYLVVEADEAPSIREGLAPPGLLSPQEAERLAGLRFPARRRKWLLGRLAAKRLLGALLEGAPAPERITVANEPSGLPFAELDGRRLPFSLSISHRAELGACAVCPTPMGLDLELVEPRDPALVRDFFTPAEAAQVAACTGRAAQLAVARIWSAKEAALKALGVGLRLDTRSLEVVPEGEGDGLPPGFTPLTVVLEGRRLPGGWRDEGRYVLTLVRHPN